MAQKRRALRRPALVGTPMAPLALALAPRLRISLPALVCGQPWKIMCLAEEEASRAPAHPTPTPGPLKRGFLATAP